MEKIAIIGGGWAGLTSALLLSEKNEVHLFESSANLGGRARSFRQKMRFWTMGPICFFPDINLLSKFLKKYISTSTIYIQ